MIDGFLNTLRKSGERVQRRSEEVAQAARLRVDIFQLGREQGMMYARLGRAYHANASVSTLEEIRAEIARVDEEISAREKLLAELGTDLGSDLRDTGDLDLSKPPVSPQSTGQPGPTPGDAQISTDAQTAMSVWREKEAKRMSDSEREVGVPTDATGRPDGENADVTTQAGGDHNKKPYASDTGQPTNPNEAGAQDKPQPTANTASMGRESERDDMVRHDNHLKEGRLASENPDPLASKD